MIDDNWIGKKVTCIIRGTEVTDARLQKESDRYFICQNVANGSPCNDKLGYKFSYAIGRGDDIEEIDLKLAPRTIDDLEQGDILVEVDGDECEVLGICGRVIFLSHSGSFEKIDSDTYTLEELKGLGMKLKQPEEEALEVTMEDICTMYGRTVKITKGEE